MPLSLEQIYDQHAQSLYAFLLNLTRSEIETKDLFQEIFSKLAAHPSLLDGVRDLRAFLLKIARNAAYDALRRQSARVRNHEMFAQESPAFFEKSDDPDEQHFRGALEQALAALPPEQREVAHLKLWEAMTFDEIATLLHLSPNTAASRYRYAIDKLRAQLRPIYEELRHV